MVSLRTISLPVNAGAEWMLAWPERNYGDALRYAIDASAWLADGGDSVVSVAASEAGTLVLTSVQYILTAGIVTGWNVKIGGGTAGETSIVRFQVVLAQGEALYFDVTLHTRVDAGLAFTPIAPLGPNAAGVYTIGGQIITIGGQTFTVGAL